MVAEQRSEQVADDGDFFRWQPDDDRRAGFPTGRPDDLETAATQFKGMVLVDQDIGGHLAGWHDVIGGAGHAAEYSPRTTPVVLTERLGVTPVLGVIAMGNDLAVRGAEHLEPAKLVGVALGQDNVADWLGGHLGKQRLATTGIPEG